MRKRKRSTQHHRQGDPLKEIYSVNSVLYSTNLKDRDYDNEQLKLEESELRKKGFTMKSKDKKKQKKQQKDEKSSSSSDEDGQVVRVTVPESYYKTNLEGSLNRDKEEINYAAETGNFPRYD